MSDWKTIDQLPPEDQEKARKLFTAEEIVRIGDYEFTYFGPQLKRRVQPALTKTTLGEPKTAAGKPPSKPKPLEAPIAPEAGERVVTIPLPDLVESNLNPRKYFGADDLTELTNSIKSAGIIQPIVVRLRADGKYEIVVGHRRVRAAKQAGLPGAPALIRVLTDSQVLEIQLIENLQRVDIDPIDEAESLKMALTLKDEAGALRYSIETLAGRLGTSAQHVHDRLRLLRLPAEGRKAIQEGVLGESIGYLIAKVPADELRKKLTKEVIKGFDGAPMSANETRQHIRRNYMVELRGSPFDQKDATLVPIREEAGARCFGGACSDCPFNSVNMPEKEKLSHPLCTLPTCYQEKVTANVRAVKDKALAAGAVVIEGPKARGMVYHDGTPGYQSGMINIDQAPSTSEVVGNKKPPTWRKMLEAKVAPITQNVETMKGKSQGTVKHAAEVRIKPTVVIDEKGKAHTLVPRKLAVEAAKKNGFQDLFAGKGGGSRGSSEQKDREAKERAKKKLETTIASAALGDLVAEISKRGFSGEDAWGAMLELAFHHAGSDSLSFVCARRDVPLKKDGNGYVDKGKALRKFADDLLPAQIPSLCIELFVAGWMRWSGVDAPGFMALAEVFEIDVEAIKLRVKAEAAEKKKPASKPVAKKEKAPLETVRAEIERLADERGLSTADIGKIAQRECKVAFLDARGHELTTIRDAVKEIPVPSPGKKKGPGGITPEDRARIAAKQRARWAARKKGAAATTDERILAAIQAAGEKGITVKQLAEDLKENHKLIIGLIAELVADKEIKKIAPATYVATEVKI